MTMSEILKAAYDRACAETQSKKQAGIWEGARLRERDAYEQGLWDAWKIAEKAES